MRAKHTVYVGVASQLRDFLTQLNCKRGCKTPGCSGILRFRKVRTHGLGGALEADIFCTGCDTRLEFASSPRVKPRPSMTPVPAVDLAMQVAFMAAGCMHSQYRKVLNLALGMTSTSASSFHKRLEIIYPVVKSMLDEACEQAKAEMKGMNQAALGSWQRAITTADGVCLTRGYHSQNHSFTIRNYRNNALLYYKHLCMRGQDSVVEEPLYDCTAKSAEGVAAEHCFQKAVEEGMFIIVYWQDADSSSSKSFRQFYPDKKESRLMLSGGHVGRPHGNALKNHAKHKGLEQGYRNLHQTKFPDITSVACHCKKHSKGCGCLSKSFLSQAKLNFYSCLDQAGTDSDKFARTMRCLGKYHARDQHEWEEEVLDRDTQKKV